jgi:hypothetical protein
MNDSLTAMSKDMQDLSSHIKQAVIKMELDYGIQISSIEINRTSKPINENRNFITVKPTFLFSFSK